MQMIRAEHNADIDPGDAPTINRRVRHFCFVLSESMFLTHRRPRGFVSETGQPLFKPVTG